jgi:hypothetical protein
LNRFFTYQEEEDDPIKVAVQLIETGCPEARANHVVETGSCESVDGKTSESSRKGTLASLKGQHRRAIKLWKAGALPRCTFLSTCFFLSCKNAKMLPQQLFVAIFFSKKVLRGRGANPGSFGILIYFLSLFC